MRKILLPLLLVIVAVCSAQLDPHGPNLGASFDLYEAGNKVGEIYVPGREPGVSHYLEHWVLFPNYVYPGPRNLTTLQIIPKATSPYMDEADFFRRVAFGRGSRYVRVTADEFTQLPAVQ